MPLPSGNSANTAYLPTSQALLLPPLKLRGGFLFLFEVHKCIAKPGHSIFSDRILDMQIMSCHVSFHMTGHAANRINIHANKEAQLFEIRVFSRGHLNRKIGETWFVTYSPHDFSVCYPIQQKKK